MSLLTTKVTENETLQELLNKFGTHYAIVGKPNELSKFLKASSIPVPDLTTDKAKKEIKFVQFLTERYGTKGPFLEKYPWGPNDCLEDAEIEEIKSNMFQNGTTFRQELEDYLDEMYHMDELIPLDWNGDYDVLSDFYDSNDVEEDDDFYIDLFWEYANYDYDLETLLSQSNHASLYYID